MSRYSAFDAVGGHGWGEIVWLPRPVPTEPVTRRYVVKVGDRTIGEVWALDPGWCAISAARSEDLAGLRSVSGFRTRWAATEYLLNVGVRGRETE